jgi:hypothetical protein
MLELGGSSLSPLSPSVVRVYAAFGGKKPILAMICDQWLAQSDVAGIAGQLMAEPDARRRLVLIAHLNRRQWELGQDVVPMLEAAAAGDADVARMLTGWKEQRAAMIREAIKPLAGKLRSGTTWQDASAAVRALSAAEIYSELVGGEGWSPDRYEAWLAELLATELLGH